MGCVATRTIRWAFSWQGRGSQLLDPHGRRRAPKVPSNGLTNSLQGDIDKQAHAQDVAKQGLQIRP
jgi:hypothetical protein